MLALMARPDRPLGPDRIAVWRHPLVVRLTHWINALCVLMLVMSGLQILRAHPHLYWGLSSTFADPWLSLGDIPGWLTIPSYRDLATGRNWHFLFAWVFVLNGLIYLAFALLSGRLKRVLWPTRGELSGIGASIREHARFHFPDDETARAYNVLQKLSYLLILLVFLPLMLFTGLGMSPGWNAAMPWMLEVVGGRQSARTLHFLAASGVVLFALVHVILVFAAGFRNLMGSMITGWFVIRASPATEAEAREEPPHDPS